MAPNMQRMRKQSLQMKSKLAKTLFKKINKENMKKGGAISSSSSRNDRVINALGNLLLALLHP